MEVNNPYRQAVETETDDDDTLLTQFLYDDKSIEELSDSRGENWADTYHVLLEKLGDLSEEE